MIAQVFSTIYNSVEIEIDPHGHMHINDITWKVNIMSWLLVPKATKIRLGLWKVESLTARLDTILPSTYLDKSHAQCHYLKQ